MSDALFSRRGRLPAKAALLLACAWPLLPLSAQTVPATGSAQALHAQGKYAEAANQGMHQLLAEPWNHALRFTVAESLERSGRINEALAQYEALEGTSMTSAANDRLQALRPQRLTGMPSVRPMNVAPVGAVPGQAASGRAASGRAASGRAASGRAASGRAASGAVVPGPAASAVLAQNGMVRSDQVTTQAPLYQYGQPGSAVPAPIPGVTGRRTVPRPGISSTPERAQPSRSPGAQEIVDLNAAEKYGAVASRGLALMKKEKVDDDIRLMIANSLAWTGRLPEAAAQYRALQKGPYASQAQVGLANVYRWQGNDEQAAPIYRNVLAVEPGNADAKEGLRLAERELAPRTSITVGGNKDSSDMHRGMATINHRWRDESGKQVYEIETSGVNDRMNDVHARQSDLTMRYLSKGATLQPSVELSLQNRPERTAFGSVRVKMAENQSFVEAGRVNWGRLASNARALDLRLTANHAALQAADTFSFGTVSARADYYDISDGNKVVTSTFQYSPFWRPLGSRLKPYVGIETRDARFNTPNYWSPANGFGSVYGGVLAEWNATDWSLYANGLRGVRLYGEAGNSWSLSAGGRRWIDQDLSIGFSLWTLSNVRDNSAYRDKSFTMNVEKLWK